MKQHVNDISETLSGLLSELQSLRKTVDSQHAEICALNRNVDRLLKENRELRKRLEKYEKPPKDSGNSSTPPSKEPMKSEAERRTKSLHQKASKDPFLIFKYNGVKTTKEKLTMMRCSASPILNCQRTL